MLEILTNIYTDEGKQLHNRLDIYFSGKFFTKYLQELCLNSVSEIYYYSSYLHCFSWTQLHNNYEC